MIHPNPYIQNLVETLQGVLRTFGVRRIYWCVTESVNTYNVRYTILYPEPGMGYSNAVNIARSLLEHEVPRKPIDFWERVRDGIIWQVVMRVVDDPTPVDAKSVEYIAAPPQVTP